ncbi:MAG: SusC/RagA family TonB-linked outer membrane protein [Gemmatimonadota bacterium]
MLGPIVRRTLRISVAAMFAAAIPMAAQAQVGQIVGTVTHGDTGEPVSSVQISVQGTGLGVVTPANGSYTIQNVPAGIYIVQAQRLGFQVIRQEEVTVTSGQATTLNLVMRPTVLALQEIVATGLVDPVEGVRSPISVARVTREMMPVSAAGNAVQNLQGRIAGVTMNRNSGQPGSGVTMMLRTPTSIRQSGFPMIVIDGVIMGGVTDDPNSTAIDGMDIESIEVIRGAAAASLYGSRAAAGVIAITTARGQGLEQGQTRFSARSEYGVTQAGDADDLASHHWFLVDDPINPTMYVDAQGNEVSRNDRVAPPDHLKFQDKPYPGPIFDNVGTLWQSGAYQQHNFSVSQNAATTNFAVSLNRTVEEGSVEGNDGYSRNAIRVNLDHRFANALSLGVSMYHARDARENIVGAFFGPSLEAPRDIDLSRIDPETGQYAQQPDPTGLSDFQNPLWTQATRENDTKGTRTMASTNLRWDPLSWLSASGVVSYDRRDSETRSYVPKGTPPDLDDEGGTPDEGSISFNSFYTDTWNAEAQVSLRRDFGALNVRTTFRALMERDQTTTSSTSGQDFIVAGIPSIDNTPDSTQRGGSASREIRSLGYLVDVAFDYDAKYILTVLGRRDGSSLFGPDNRWHEYYRVAGAWRLAEEDWFNIPNVDEFKLSYARGTAGGRPSWAYQYETFNISSSTGALTRATLGNVNLRPEHTTENEASLDMILYNRFGVKLTHAWQETREQLTQAPLPGFIGFPAQWINQGAVAGHTTELSVDGSIYESQNFGWQTQFIADKSYAEITEWDIPCQTQNWRLYCTEDAEGNSVPVYSLHGNRLLTSLSQLDTHANGVLAPFKDQFQVNDEGYVVWVGDVDYTDGMVNGVVTDGTWGTTMPGTGALEVQVGDVFWGVPFFLRDAGGTVMRTSMGETNPLNLGWLNNLRWGNFNVHTHLHASIGGDANNRWFQTMTQGANLNTPYQDQSGKPDGLKKPFQYYFLAVGSGGSNYVVEDATYFKLRTLSVNYRFSQPQLQQFGLGAIGIQSLQLGLIGRNIFTITNFSGFDPEQSLDLNDRQNVGGAGYPATRTFTAEVSVTF